MQTFSYKGWFIHINFMVSPEVVSVQSPDYELFSVKSVHAAKCFITKRSKPCRP